MVNLAALIASNAARWAVMKIDPARKAEFAAVAAKLLKNKARFQEIEARTGVLWWVVAVIFERESGGNFLAYIGNGQPLGRCTTEVPIGRGPFKSWEDGCVDALIECAPHAAYWHDWTAGGVLTLLEKYNGLGYVARSMASPYIWSGTNQYERGKYVADHDFDANVVDSQLGCAPLIAAMRKQDSSIRFAGEMPAAAGPIAAGGGVVIAGGTLAAAAGAPWWVIAAGALAIAAVVALIIWARKTA